MKPSPTWTWWVTVAVLIFGVASTPVRVLDPHGGTVSDPNVTALAV